MLKGLFQIKIRESDAVAPKGRTKLVECIESRTKKKKKIRKVCSIFVYGRCVLFFLFMEGVFYFCLYKVCSIFVYGRCVLFLFMEGENAIGVFVGFVSPHISGWGDFQSFMVLLVQWSDKSENICPKHFCRQMGKLSLLTCLLNATLLY